MPTEPKEISEHLPNKLDKKLFSPENAVRKILKKHFDHEKHAHREQMVARGISSLEEFYMAYWEWGEKLSLPEQQLMTNDIPPVYSISQKHNYVAKCKESLELAKFPEPTKKELIQWLYKSLHGEVIHGDKDMQKAIKRYEGIDYTDAEARKKTTWNEEVTIDTPPPNIPPLDPTTR